METRYQRIAREQKERREAREAVARQRNRRTKARPNWRKIADRIDGYDRDDLGESPDY